MKKDEFKGSFFERVANARAMNALTQAELAKLVGVSQRQIAAYESADSFPRPGTLQKLANALGTTPEWLADGLGDGKIKSRISPALVSRLIPILPASEVFYFLASGYNPQGLTTEFHPTSHPVSDMAFALSNQDEAMAYSDPDGYGFPIGSIVVFDPMVEAEHLDYVCVLKDDLKILFRQLFITYDIYALSPLDRRYPQETLRDDVKDMFIIPAVFVEAKLPAMSRLNEWKRGDNTESAPHPINIHDESNKNPT